MSFNLVPDSIREVRRLDIKRLMVAEENSF